MFEITILKLLIKKYKIQRKFIKLSKILKQEGLILNSHLKKRDWKQTSYWLEQRKKTMTAIKRVLKKYENN